MSFIAALVLAGFEHCRSTDDPGAYASPMGRAHRTAPVVVHPAGPDVNVIKAVGQKVDQGQSRPRSKKRYDKMIQHVALAHGVSPALVMAVIKTESDFNPRAVSAMGAVGLMQVLPSTARRHGVYNPYDTRSNITAGVRYLKKLLDMFQNDEALALAAYNCGPVRVQRYGRVPPFRETRILSTAS